MSDKPHHWEGVYRSKAESVTSWFKERPQVSLDLIAATGAGQGRRLRCRKSYNVFPR